VSRSSAGRKEEYAGSGEERYSGGKERRSMSRAYIGRGTTNFDRIGAWFTAINGGSRF
jgi:hypothetical protein